MFNPRLPFFHAHPQRPIQAAASKINEEAPSSVAEGSQRQPTADQFQGRDTWDGSQETWSFTSPTSSTVTSPPESPDWMQERESVPGFFTRLLQTPPSFLQTNLQTNAGLTLGNASGREKEPQTAVKEAHLEAWPIPPHNRNKGKNIVAEHFNSSEDSRISPRVSSGHAASSFMFSSGQPHETELEGIQPYLTGQQNPDEAGTALSMYPSFPQSHLANPPSMPSNPFSALSGHPPQPSQSFPEPHAAERDVEQLWYFITSGGLEKNMLQPEEWSILSQLATSPTQSRSSSRLQPDPGHRPAIDHKQKGVMTDFDFREPSQNPLQNSPVHLPSSPFSQTAWWHTDDDALSLSNASWLKEDGENSEASGEPEVSSTPLPTTQPNKKKTRNRPPARPNDAKRLSIPLAKQRELFLSFYNKNKDGNLKPGQIIQEFRRKHFDLPVTTVKTWLLQDGITKPPERERRFYEKFGIFFRQNQPTLSGKSYIQMIEKFLEQEKDPAFSKIKPGTIKNYIGRFFRENPEIWNSNFNPDHKKEFLEYYHAQKSDNTTTRQLRVNFSKQYFRVPDKTARQWLQKGNTRLTKKELEF